MGKREPQTAGQLWMMLEKETEEAGDGQESRLRRCLRLEKQEFGPSSLSRAD